MFALLIHTYIRASPSLTKRKLSLNDPLVSERVPSCSQDSSAVPSGHRSYDSGQRFVIASFQYRVSIATFSSCLKSSLFFGLEVALPSLQG